MRSTALTTSARPVLAMVAALLLWSPPAAALDLYIEPEIQSRTSSNVYLTKQAEWDVAFMPRLNGGVNFAKFWTLGLATRMNVYPRHADLLYHRHELFLFANPSWGDQGENELLVRFSTQTQRNAAEYAAINHVKPSLSARLSLEQTDWLRWKLSQDLSFAWFYDDQPTTALDAWTKGSFTITSQTRTTISPRVGYGVRYYPHSDQTPADDTQDQQVEAGIHLSQGLFERVGMQLDYAYLHAFGPSGLVQQKLSATEFSYIGEDFLFSGHRAGVIYKHLLGARWSLGGSLLFETRAYSGWLVEDTASTSTGVPQEERQDYRLSPGAWFEYAWSAKEGASRALPEGKLAFEYLFLRQWSNDPWHDTTLHLVTLNLLLSWSV